MQPLRARVHQGRLILDEPTSLPEGAVLDLVADDEGDDMDDEAREALDNALAGASESANRGQLRPADSILRDLRAGRS